jgi:hypothetical protein
MYYAEGKIQEGIQLFQTCYSQNPNNPGTLQEIAKCLQVYNKSKIKMYIFY